jgi:hypothetical protein
MNVSKGHRRKIRGKRRFALHVRWCRGTRPEKEPEGAFPAQTLKAEREGKAPAERSRHLERDRNNEKRLR